MPFNRTAFKFKGLIIFNIIAGDTKSPDSLDQRRMLEFRLYRRQHNKR